MKSRLNTRFLILAIALAFSSIGSLGQGTQQVLVAVKNKSLKQITFNVGQTASYKTDKSKSFQKGKIYEITDSTISFSNKKYKLDIVRIRDIKEFKALKPGRSGGGAALIVAGVGGVLLGFAAIGLAESHIGSGNAGPTALIPVGGALLMIAGIAVLQPDVVNTSTLKVRTKETLVEEKKKALLADSVPHYQKYKVGVFGGYATPLSGPSGVLVTLEPGIKLNDVAFGLRIEHAALKFDPQHLAGNPGGTIPGSSGTTSVTGNLQIYLADGNLRPFLGFGVGPYFFSNPTIIKFGFYPRFGFDVDHFTFSMDYNVLPSVSGEVNLNPCSDPANMGNCGEIFSYTQYYSYVAFRLGYTFGGGKR